MRLPRNAPKDEDFLVLPFSMTATYSTDRFPTPVIPAKAGIQDISISNGNTGSCEKIELWRYPGNSVRRSARSTWVERALRARCRPWIQNREEQNAYGSIFHSFQVLEARLRWHDLWKAWKALTQLPEFA